ncbi:hypothetical protein C8J57DRAFT_1511081 [Mycena rebaudengoi]|nr:hypothetical protein C8J57DRAFT_1511081 [Mycena rebaudengoi]
MVVEDLAAAAVSEASHHRHVLRHSSHPLDFLTVSRSILPYQSRQPNLIKCSWCSRRTHGFSLRIIAEWPGIVDAARRLRCAEEDSTLGLSVSEAWRAGIWASVYWMLAKVYAAAHAPSHRPQRTRKALTPSLLPLFYRIVRVPLRYPLLFPAAAPRCAARPFSVAPRRPHFITTSPPCHWPLLRSSRSSAPHPNTTPLRLPPPVVLSLPSSIRTLLPLLPSPSSPSLHPIRSPLRTLHLFRFGPSLHTFFVSLRPSHPPSRLPSPVPSPYTVDVASTRPILPPSLYKITKKSHSHDVSLVAMRSQFIDILTP